ncbi:hypothetical protein FA95DRAFT_1556870 [Auriscalpium vulgare]|uniref:Uncharacterized protein n=1 Tax=Auriscalpium vulgare TaxID=40419 RepID=A0ACB8RZS9_9AGAM|nr:hypothetical protein FA95DRAFT_1556870 [Auriscalpium vulgare]
MWSLLLTILAWHSFVQAGAARIAERPQSYEVTIHRQPGTQSCHIVRERETPLHRRLSSSDSDSYIADTTIIQRHDGKGDVEQIRLFARSKSRVQDHHIAQLCDAGSSPQLADDPLQRVLQHNVASITAPYDAERRYIPLDDVVPIVGHGDSSNRVDVAFFADGYLASERSKFMTDVTRLVDEISANQTFHTVAPLLKFWAVFVPSNETGVGVGGVPKDTPFGLYRDGTELRGLYYAHPEVARAACDALGDRCDYPVLLGNDPFYGGLGGEFTTITSSEVNGQLVLRHELGHSMINVGEEYDGGFSYFGPNAGLDLSEPVPWAHWIPSSNEPLRVERSAMPFQAYPWTLLNVTEPWVATFNSSGAYARYLVRFSLSGLPEKTDLSVVLDGKDLGWVPKPGLGVDRWHYDIQSDVPLKEGQHEVKFALNEGNREGIAQLCSLEILEFGSGTEFNSTRGVYGLFPTFSYQNETSYRPTNEDCLMRAVALPTFCSACIEGLWLSLLGRVDLVDDLQASCSFNVSSSKWIRTLQLSLAPLGQFREETVKNEKYTIAWAKNGVPLDQYADQTAIVVSGEDLGRFDVVVTFVTDEVRVDQHSLLQSHRRAFISHRCE